MIFLPSFIIRFVRTERVVNSSALLELGNPRGHWGRTSSTPLLLLDCAHMGLFMDNVLCADPGEGEARTGLILGSSVRLAIGIQLRRVCQRLPVLEQPVVGLKPSWLAMAPVGHCEARSWPKQSPSLAIGGDCFARAARNDGKEGRLAGCRWQAARNHDCAAPTQNPIASGPPSPGSAQGISIHEPLHWRAVQEKERGR